VKRVICLSGPDGSGKSTLARLLAKHLSSNRRVKVSWLRGISYHSFTNGQVPITVQQHEGTG